MIHFAARKIGDALLTLAVMFVVFEGPTILAVARHKLRSRA
jgi:hypothetical protein